MHHVERRPFILLELLISMSLTLVLLSALTYFYQQVNWVNREMDEVQNEAFKMLYVESRLSSILPRANAPSDQQLDFFFFTSPDLGGMYRLGTNSLLFTFDNCVKLDKDFAYIVLGRLFLDREGNLTLATWPPPKRWVENEQPPIKKEILLENVEDLEFQFFSAPKKGQGKEEPQQEQQPQQQEELEAAPVPEIERGRWLSEWRKEYQELPSIVRIIVKQKEATMLFAYPIPLSNKTQPITYDQ